jgi:hypothetical protein
MFHSKLLKGRKYLFSFGGIGKSERASLLYPTRTFERNIRDMKHDNIRKGYLKVGVDDNDRL